MWLALSICLLGPPAWAHQPTDGDIHAAAGEFTYMTHPLDHTFHAPVQAAPGLIAEGDLDNHGGLEISLFYLDNPFSVEQGGRVITEKVKRVYIASGYRLWFNPRFSVALAFYSTYSMGRARVVRNDFGDEPDHPDTSAHDMTEYGFDGSVEYEPWSIDRFSLIVDGRYAYSVTPKRHEDGNDFGLFVGIKYFVQSREKSIQ